MSGILGRRLVNHSHRQKLLPHLRDTEFSHSPDNSPGVVGRVIAPATEVEPQRPVRWEKGTTNQLMTKKHWLIFEKADSLTHFSVLLDNFLWRWAQKEVQVQYATDGPIRD